MKYLIVVFTGKDDLDYGNKTVDDMVRDAPPCLRKILNGCDNRYFALNNISKRKSEKEKQVEELIEMIQNVVCKNGGSYYQSPIFDQVDMIIQERMIEKEREEMTRVRMLMEEEYRERDRMARFREEKLQDQLRNLDVQQTRVSLRMKHLGKPIDEYLDDEENKQINEINSRIVGVKREISEVQRDRHKMQSSAMDMDDRLEDIRRGYNPREEVRDEIERGDANILKRFWNKITKAGEELVGRFKSFFELLKQKAGFK